MSFARMNAVTRLAVAMTMGACVVLGVHEVVRERREATAFEHDLRRDHDDLGRALSTIAAHAWERGGRDAATAALSEALPVREELHVELVGPEAKPTVARDVIVSHTLVRVKGVIVAVIELREHAAGADRFLQRSRHELLATLIATAGVLGLIAAALGETVVRRPIAAALQEQTDRLRAETDARLATVQQLRHADRLALVGQIAASQAHELGTPLNVVLARSAELAAGTLESKEVSRYGRSIGEAAERMTRVIRQMLDFSRRPSPQPARRDLADVAERTVKLVEPLARKRGVHLEVVRKGPARAEIDTSALEQVLANLLVNAIHAMPEGGPITVTCDTADGQAYLQVEDRGHGIAADDLPRIFEPFFTRKGSGDGTGLGLSVARGIVEEHRGSLSAESTVGEGSTFTLRLPAV